MRLIAEGFMVGAGAHLDETMDWYKRAVANGSSGASEAVLRAIDVYVADLKTAGVWSLLQRANLFCGSDLAACLTPLVKTLGNATDTNTNFVSGDYSQTGGLTGNGTNKYLDTGVAGNALAANNRHISVREFAPSANTFRSSIGQGSAGAAIWTLGTNGAATTYQYVSNLSGTGVTFASVSGGAHWTGTNSNPSVLYKDGTAAQTTTPTPPTPSSPSISIFARNLDGTRGQYSEARLGGYTIGQSLTSTQVAALAAADLKFNQTLGRS